MDWDVLEAEMIAVERRIPKIGAPYPTGRSNNCDAKLGRLWCCKDHSEEDDPVHVSSHRDPYIPSESYGVIAVWEDGHRPQLHRRLVERTWPLGLYWLTGLVQPHKFTVIDPTEGQACG